MPVDKFLAGAPQPAFSCLIFLCCLECGELDQLDHGAVLADVCTAKYHPTLHLSLYKCILGNSVFFLFLKGLSGQIRFL